jgi:hypothetical protein
MSAARLRVGQPRTRSGYGARLKGGVLAQESIQRGEKRPRPRSDLHEAFEARVIHHIFCPVQGESHDETVRLGDVPPMFTNRLANWNWNRSRSLLNGML